MYPTLNHIQNYTINPTDKWHIDLQKPNRNTHKNNKEICRNPLRITILNFAFTHPNLIHNLASLYIPFLHVSN